MSGETDEGDGEALSQKQVDESGGLLGQDYRPDMPDWGAFLRWPTDGVQWLHEDDIAIAKRLLPSQRVFCRRKWDGEYYWLQYGQDEIRIRPVMWTQVPQVDLDVGQQVELLARLGKNDPGVFRVAEILFCAALGRVSFRLTRDTLTLKKQFLREDLRPVSVKHHLRTGYYHHQAPKLDAAVKTETLYVGDLLEDD